MKIALLSLVVIAVSIQETFGATFNEAIKTEIQYGKAIKYCEYEGMKLFPGSRFKRLDNCMKCQCTSSGLGCQTMYAKMEANGPSACRHVSRGCKGRWVLIDNPYKKCPNRLVPKGATGTGK